MVYLRVISFDIEVVPLREQMPNPQNCEIILISCVFNHKVKFEECYSDKVSFVLTKKVSEEEWLSKNWITDGNKIYKLNYSVSGRVKWFAVDNDISNSIDIDNIGNNIDIDNIGDSVICNGGIVYIYDDEVKMIERFFELVRKCDVITGYNINGFDWVYIIDRCKALGMKNVKLGNGDGVLYHREHLSKGMKVVKIGGLTGKIVFDVLYLLRREDASNIFKKKYNLKRLKLEDVSREILRKEKLEFSPLEMIRYWEMCSGSNVSGSNVSGSNVSGSNVSGSNVSGSNVSGSSDELMMKMIRYGRVDAELPFEFVTKFRLLDKFITLSKRSGKLVQEIINSQGSGLMVENLIMKANLAEGRVTPCRVHSYGSKHEYKELSGAEVFEPKLGLSENLGSIDYKSLYPSLMIKNNLCYSTLVDYDRSSGDDSLDANLIKLKSEDKIEEQTFEDGTVYGYFIKKEEYVGIIPRILKGLLDERAFLKKEMKKYEKNSSDYMMLDATQEAVKILLNSFYGYSGDSSSKTYSWIVASAVTTNGRKQIKKTWDIIKNEISVIDVTGSVKKYRLDVAGGDTDSSYIQVVSDDGRNIISRNDVIYCINKVIDYINNKLEKPMELAFENYINRMIIVAKKRYAMLVVDDNGKKVIITKGLEVVRRDWCDLSTDIMGNIIDLILMEEKVDEGIKKSVDLIKESIKKLKRSEIDVSKLIITNKLTKPMTEYDNKEVHVLVAIKMKNRGRPSEVGDRIEYIIIDNGKELVGERAEDYKWFIENRDKLRLKIDYDYYIHHQIIPPAMRVLELLGVTKQVLLVGIDEKQRLISEWF